MDRNLALDLVRVTEAAALASKSASGVAVSANSLPSAARRSAARIGPRSLPETAIISPKISARIG